MTVIEIGKKDIMNPITLSMITFVLLSVFGFLFFYKNLITLRHDLANNKNVIEMEQVKNAELKNNLYKIVDEMSQEDFLRESGFVFDQSPYYVQSFSEISYAE